MSSRLILLIFCLSSQTALALQGPAPAMLGKWKFAKAECSSGAPNKSVQELNDLKMEAVVITADLVHFKFSEIKVPHDGKIEVCSMKLSFPYEVTGDIMKLGPRKNLTLSCPVDLKIESDPNSSDPIRVEVSEDTMKYTMVHPVTDLDGDCPIGDIGTVTFTRVK